MPERYTRVSPQAARYTPAGGVEHCSACRFYKPPSFCARITDPVSPHGWCKFFSREMVLRWDMGGGDAVAGAGGPSLDLDFMNVGALPSGVTFTRASTGTYFDATGTLQSAAVNAPRWDYDPVTHVLRGLLIEEARTNVLLNSATLATQSVAVTAQAYVLSFYGTGTVTLSGAFAGSLVGTGAFPTRVSLPFTPTAGTLTLTVTGSVLNANLEAGSFATSFVATTAAAVTRAADVARIPPANMGFFVSPGGSWMAEFIEQTPVPNIQNGRIITQPSAGGITPIFITSALSQFDGSAILATANFVTAGVVLKGASTYAAGGSSVCLNGGAVATAVLTTGYGGLVASGIAFLISTPAGSPENTSGYLRRVRYWPRVLSAAELQQVTA